MEEARAQSRLQTMTLNEEVDSANPTGSTNTDEDPAGNRPLDYGKKGS